MDRRTSFFLTAAAITLGLGMLLILQFRESGRFRLIFCDIGQGDGMLLITPGGSQIVVDGGPGDRILGCLAKHMPFWDRDIEVMVSTHPQQDHMQGLISVVERYSVKYIVTTSIGSSAQFFKAWEQAVVAESSNIITAKAGEVVRLDGVDLQIIWPRADLLEVWRNNPPADLNETSVVIKAIYGDFCAYLTGDAPKEILKTITSESCEVLKVSHHGSRTGTDKTVVELAAPQIAIAQLGAKNRYGHPHAEVTEALEGVRFLRNDLHGEVEVTTDGEKYWIP